MGKKGRKKTSSSAPKKSFVKFELVGLAILSAAGLGLAGAGRVGKWIDYIFIFLAGNWYFLPLLYGVYLAIHVMIKRSKPVMSRRKMGLFLLFFVMVTWSHLNLYRDIGTYPSKVKTDLWQVTSSGVDTLYDSKTKVPIHGTAPVRSTAGGGAIGYLLFKLTHSLFDTSGTLFVLILSTIASFILITQKSVVQIATFVKTFLQRRALRLKESGVEFWQMMRTPADTPSTPQKKLTEKKNPIAETQREPIRIRDFTDSWSDQEEVVPIADEQGKPSIKQVPDKSVIQVSWPKKKPQPMEEPPDVEPFHLETSENDESYVMPSMDLLNAPKGPRMTADRRDMENNALKLQETLASFGVQVTVQEAHRGPTVTRFEIQPAVGVKVSRIVNLADDLALALAAKDIRIEAPIPGKAAVGIEVPNREVSMVTLREVVETPEFMQTESKLSVVLGRDISGMPIVGNLGKMPHVMIAGSTGSGKSVCVNGIITSILYKAKPSEVKFIMIDPKMVELNVYNGIPHLLTPVVTDARKAAHALKKVVQEMESRYDLFSKEGARNIEGYNSMMHAQERPALPFIVVIIDELADLMMVAPNDVEDAICRLAQMARAAGIHLILATQRPSVDVITGLIKANIPSRIAFAVSSQTDSRTILDMGGAEKLLGRGDMLYLPVGESKPIRIQGAFLSDNEVEKVVAHVKEQQQAHYHLDLSGSVESSSKSDDDLDSLFWDAVQTVVDSEQASVSLIQRRLKVGYARAARIIDQMEEKGIVGPFEGSKPREVRITREQLQLQLEDQALGG